MKAATILAVAVCLVAPQAAWAVITFDQLDDDIFVVSHRIKVIGSRGKAMRMVYEKAASLCIAAGYSHFRILDQESEAIQEDDAANASVRVRFFFADGDERAECEAKASPEYIGQARDKLTRMGYRPPDLAERAEAAGRGARRDRELHDRTDRGDGPGGPDGRADRGGLRRRVPMRAPMRVSR